MHGAMKIHHVLDRNRLRIEISGEIEADSCRCLQSFWELRAGGRMDIEVDLGEAETGESDGLAVFTGLVEQSLIAGARVQIVRAPQMLAHTLYKAGFLTRFPRLKLTSPRLEEPYQG